MSSNPKEIRRKSSLGHASTPESPSRSNSTRHIFNARLSSPIPGSFRHTTPPSSHPQTPASGVADNSSQQDLAKIDDQSSLPGPGPSALSSALASSSPPTVIMSKSPSSQQIASSQAGLSSHDRLPRTNYGSMDTRQLAGSPMPLEDPEIIRRHLVQPDEVVAKKNSVRFRHDDHGLGTDEFSSLRLQGGDITREVYKWAEENAEGGTRGRQKQNRRQSFQVNRPDPESEIMDIHSIRQPGGFRRNFLRRAADSPTPSGRLSQVDGTTDRHDMANLSPRPPPQLFTNSFLEFLTLYGHFAGEDLEEDDDDNEGGYFSSATYDTDDEDAREPGEDSGLLTPGTPGTRRRRRYKTGSPTGTNSAMNAALLLLKSFVGTGVLFLPRAFLNGGMLFSSLLLLGVAALSFYCFILLVNTRLKVEGSFGDIGGILYGKWMRALILFSIVISQIGFVSAYIVFTAENLQAFVLAVSKCATYIDIKFMVMLQLVIFLPLSLIRDIGKLGFTALIADAFILLGLLYLYYYNIDTIVYNHGISDIQLFNPSSWTLFIGTAIFAFEGVGLIIPIQESMKRPEQFMGVLGVVMIIVTVLMTSIGVLSYAAYGSQTRTVVLLNLPQDNKMVNGVQFLYSLAILLSTPLQLFPAIRIMENEIFTRSGKYNRSIKWKKNVFRFFLVVLCALIAWVGANDLDKFVALVGSFACVPLVYVYPPLLHLRACSKTAWQRFADYGLCVFGIVSCVYTTVLTVQQWAGSSPGEPPGYCD